MEITNFTQEELKILLDSIRYYHRTEYDNIGINQLTDIENKILINILGVQ